MAWKRLAGVVGGGRQQQEVGEQRKGWDTLEMAWKSSFFSYVHTVQPMYDTTS